MPAPELERPQRVSIAGWAAISIAAGIGAGLALRHPAPLADPISCAGVFDLMAVIASRTWRDVPLGSMLAAGNFILVVVALVLLARTIYRITAAAAVTMAITVAASTSVVFAITLAPSPAAAFAAAVAAWTAVLRACQGRPRMTSMVIALALLAFLAMTVTPLTIPAAIVAGWLAWRHAPDSASSIGRVIRATLALSIVTAASLPIRLAVPNEHACLLPHDLSGLIGVRRELWAVMAASPLAAVLAILGLFSIKRLPRDVAQSLVPLTLASIWGTAVLPGQPAWVLGPFVLTFWMIAAAGLADVWQALSRTSGGRVGAAALSIALVVLQVLSGNVRHTTSLTPEGHEHLTLAMVGAIVGSLPRGGGLVVEDATTDLLTRALPSRLRVADRFHFVPRDVAAITAALGSARVFVLPRSQRVLQDLGLELVDAGGGVVQGVAEVQRAHACSAALLSEPTPVPQIAGRQRITLVAADEQSRGPLVVLLSAHMSLSLQPADWPLEARRGFNARTFDLATAGDQAALSGELRTHGLSSWTAPPDGRYVTRLETWRIPGAPLVLPIDLGGTTSGGTARILGTAPDQHLRICPSLPYAVRPLATAVR